MRVWKRRSSTVPAKTYAQTVTLDSSFAPSAGGVLVPVGSNGHAQPDPQTAAAVEKAYKRKQAGLPA